MLIRPSLKMIIALLLFIGIGTAWSVLGLSYARTLRLSCRINVLERAVADTSNTRSNLAAPIRSLSCNVVKADAAQALAAIRSGNFSIATLASSSAAQATSRRPAAEDPNQAELVTLDIGVSELSGTAAGIPEAGLLVIDVTTARQAVVRSLVN